jgi:hypothetical protein
MLITFFFLIDIDVGNKDLVLADYDFSYL